MAVCSGILTLGRSTPEIPGSPAAAHPRNRMAAAAPASSEEEILGHRRMPDVHLQVPQKRLRELSSHLGERRRLVL